MRLISKIIVALVIVIIFFEFLLLSIHKRHERALVLDSASSSSARGASEKQVLKTSDVSHSTRNEQRSYDSSPGGSLSQWPAVPVIHVSAVVCGDRMEEALNMLKSVVLFTSKSVHFHILAEDKLHDKIQSSLARWPHIKTGKLHYKVYHLTFPKGESAEEWKNLFKPCASQRLFLPSVLSRVDSVLYMDTDCIVLRPVEDIWQHFARFDSKQLAAMAPESEVETLGWYNRFARHPYYGKLGVNSGVMLMNLTRMREFRWKEKIIPIYRQYRVEITWGDQDILNVLFHNHPDLLYVFTCNWNFRPDHCMYGSNCKAAEINGISVVHGNRAVFHSDKQPFFRAVYDAVSQCTLGEHVVKFVHKLQRNLVPFKDTDCGKLTEEVLKLPRQSSGAVPYM